MNQTSTSRDALSDIDSDLQDYEGGNNSAEGSSQFPRHDGNVDKTSQKSKGNPSQKQKPSSKKKKCSSDKVSSRSNSESVPPINGGWTSPEEESSEVAEPSSESKTSYKKSSLFRPRDRHIRDNEAVRNVDEESNNQGNTNPHFKKGSHISLENGKRK